MSEKKLKNKTNYQAGLTLPEILIVLFIISVIGTLIVNFQINIFSFDKISSESMNAQTDARNTLKTMSAEIRSMSAANDGSYAIYQAGTSSLSFYDDVDNDLLKERVRYFLSGNVLKKGVIKPTGSPLAYDSADEIFTILVNDIANGNSPIFYYYDKNYDGASAALPDPVDIPLVRLIKINVLIDKDPTKLPGTINVTTQISIRNLKDNL